ncbi:hypothetical protein [Eikenella longinqua]|nr:hypothetical protein [Eikenella longinqua]
MKERYRRLGANGNNGNCIQRKIFLDTQCNRRSLCCHSVGGTEKHPDKMVALRAEIEELLPHWVVGILVSLKDYLQTEENIPIFLQAIQRSLELARLSSDELYISGFSVGKDVFFEEISAFKQLITEYDTFNKNAKIYAPLSQKWITA